MSLHDALNLLGALILGGLLVWRVEIMARNRGDDGIKPQQMPKGLRPETLGELVRDERRLDRAFEQMQQREEQARREGGK